MSDVIEIVSSDEEGTADVPKQRQTTTTGGIKRSISGQVMQDKKRVKTNHVSTTVSKHLVQKSQLPSNQPRDSVMVYNPKTGVIYQKSTAKSNELKIADVRSVKNVIGDSSNKDPLSLPPTPTLTEVEIIPLRPSPNTKTGVNHRTTPSKNVPTTSGTSENGYTTTPDITIRSVQKLNSPIPGSSRTSSMSSPGAASNTSVNTTTITEIPPQQQQPPLEMNETFKELLAACRAADQSSPMDLITKKLEKYYHGVHPDFVNSPSFMRSVEKACNDIKSQPAQVFVLLKPTVDELKVRQGGVKMTDEGEIVTENDEAVTTGDPKTDKNLYRLNKTLYQVQRKIEKLREADSMWEDEVNSTYMIIGRLENHAVKIYRKICELTGENIDAKRRVKKPIKFNNTQYQEFNKALQKFYNKTKHFPDFFDVLRVLEHCNDENGYGLNRNALKTVAQNAFQELGEKLQARRKIDEYESLSYISSIVGDDPANSDPELARKLEANKKYHTRIDEVINKYAEGRHIEAAALIMSNSKLTRLNSDAGSNDSGTGEGDNPPDGELILENGSSPTAQEDNNNSTSDTIPKTSPSHFPPEIITPNPIEMEPVLLESLDNVSLLDTSSQDFDLKETAS